MESKESLLAIKNFLINLIFPKVCVACDKLENHLCDNCRQLIKLALDSKSISDIDELIFIWHYNNQVVKSLLKAFKYNFITDLDKDFSYFLNQEECSQKLRLFCSSGCLVPVPLHKKRELWRGFNQSYVIAQIISDIVGLPVKKDLIKRVLYTEQQANLGLNDRLLNLKKAFKINKSINLFETVILIDDVVTTGATLSAIAQEFKKIGVSHVKAVVLAA